MATLPPEGNESREPDGRLQPMRATQIVGRALRLWWRHILLFASIGGITGLAYQLVALPFQMEILGIERFEFSKFATSVRIAESDPGGFVGHTVRLIVFALLSSAAGFILGILLQVVVISAAATAHFGQNATLPGAWRTGFGRFAPALRAALLTGGLAGGAVLAAGILGATVYVVSFHVVGTVISKVLGVLAIIGLIISGIALTISVVVRWMFFPQAIVVDKLGAREGLKRSWNLTGGSWWRVFGILTLLWLVVQLIGLPVSVVVFVASFTAETMVEQGLAGPAVSLLMVNSLAAVIAGIIGIIGQIGSTVLYFDLRVRRGEQLSPPATA